VNDARGVVPRDHEEAVVVVAEDRQVATDLAMLLLGGLLWRAARGATLRVRVAAARLMAVTAAVRDHLSKGASVETLMGSSTDALKLVSSLTLFGHAAKQLHGAEGVAAYGALARADAEVLNAAERQGYGPCEYTISRLD